MGVIVASAVFAVFVFASTVLLVCLPVPALTINRTVVNEMTQRTTGGTKTTTDITKRRPMVLLVFRGPRLDVVFRDGGCSKRTGRRLCRCDGSRVDRDDHLVVAYWKTNEQNPCFGRRWYR